MAIKILSVDDELDLERLLTQYFRRKIKKGEYEFYFAHNGLEALQLMLVQPDFDVILSDINMPEMNGYEATEEIRKISPEVPIIAVTAYAFASDEDRIMNSGFDAYASKPLNAQVLKRQMGDLLKKRVLLI